MIAIMFETLFEPLRAVGTPVHVDGDTVFFRRTDRVRSMFVLQAGEVKLSRHLKDGNELVLYRAAGPCVLAEASLYSPSYHCDATALSACEGFKIPRQRFLRLLDADPALACAWSAHLARMLQSARQHTEILRMKRVCERVDAWLVWHDGRLPPKGRWKDVAAQIGVSAEALYRELATRKS